MTGRITTWQRYRDIAAECRKRASLAGSPKTRAGCSHRAMMKSQTPELARAAISHYERSLDHEG
jgi:hypothetical protein